MKNSIFTFLLSIILFSLPLYSKNKKILIEAESFPIKGGWVVDQQFMDQMGSPYIMAHGLGKPVEDAEYYLDLTEDDTYNVYVRTFNWTSPWTDKPGAGKFKISANDRYLKNTLGETGNKWEWQYAGKTRLKKGKNKIALHDITGFNGRCDALYLTTEDNPPLPDDGINLTNLRTKLNPSKLLPSREYDVIVVGGGIAGMCAAASAARLGSKVALVNDRPVLGGNNSSEIRVHLGARIEMNPNKGLGRMIREFGHSRKGNAMPGEYYEDEKKQNFIDAEENIVLYPNYRVIKATKKENRIQNVEAVQIETNELVKLTAPIFIDCTGDGNLGYLAEADYRTGRENKSEFGESLAPDTIDNQTMGASVQWYSIDTPKKCSFPKFEYGIDFNSNNCEPVEMGEWTWEMGIGHDQIEEAEWIRDYGLMVIFSNWNYLKNKAKLPEFQNRDLQWVAYIGGRRESRRLMGDYILKQDDIDKNVFHEDASFTTTWTIDLHFPDSINKQNFKGEAFKAKTSHYRIFPYAVPYRCLYSRNIDNLLMAGRNISCTHVGLGTVRLMRTSGMMGEVAGMAADICRRNGCTPRQVYQRHLEELKELMKKGIGKEGIDLPNNQNFNNQKNLKAPKALSNSY